MKIVFHGMSDVGRKREKNEDSFLVSGDLGIFMVADGMGGHLGGEYASKLAVQTVEESFQSADSENQDLGASLKQALKLASHKIYEEASQNPSLRGMGTTAVALLIRDGQGFIAHVGDSRAYLVREGDIKQMTVDHSLVTEQLKAGVITEDEVKHHRYKNIITRSVGFQDDVEVDLLIRDLEVGDRFLLCSDGLSNLVETSDLLKFSSKNSPEEACQKLIDLANKRGGDDNITIVVVSVEEES